MSNFLKNPIVHAILMFVLFAIPLLEKMSWTNLTIGAVLALIARAIENKVNGLTIGGSARVS